MCGGSDAAVAAIKGHVWNWIIEASLRHRKLALGPLALVAVLGVYSVHPCRSTRSPTSPTSWCRSTPWRRRSAPAEVERQITVPVEQAMGGLPRLTVVRSIPKFGLSQVWLIFEDGTDIYFARAQVLERLQAVELPQGSSVPRWGRWRPVSARSTTTSSRRRAAT